MTLSEGRCYKRGVAHSGRKRLNPTELGGMIDLIERLHAGGLTLVVIEHVMAAMMRLAQRIAVLHHGERIAEGTPPEIVGDRRVVDAYLGEEFVLAQA